MKNLRLSGVIHEVPHQACRGRGARGSVSGLHWHSHARPPDPHAAHVFTRTQNCGNKLFTQDERCWRDKGVSMAITVELLWWDCHDIRLLSLDRFIFPLTSGKSLIIPRLCWYCWLTCCCFHPKISGLKHSSNCLIFTVSQVLYLSPTSLVIVKGYSALQYFKQGFIKGDHIMKTQTEEPLPSFLEILQNT